jgi:nucleoid-associated protein YgaU
MDLRGSIRTVSASAAVALVAALLIGAPAADAASLSGSRSSVGRQNYQARRHEYTFIRTPSQVKRFVANGWLVPVRGNSDYTLHAVSFPYARPEVKLFIERLSRQYRASCGEQLVVTSLTRPTTRQPRNASPLSVHPTGMAVDLRRSWKYSCRRWLESTLLYLEGRGVLEAARERRPPHYHIALFPKPYASYLANLGKEKRDRYYVVRGDTLYSIARRHAVTVGMVKQANGLRGDRIYPGQVLKLPAR